ncbi:MAG: SMP-30/gluconolactonase/LRE family protein [Gemmatimonadetes bacterium]|nr:SMP-30/gluconolactonase/LRE family protein [Gemmatimonadota bacterium]
MDLPCQTGEGPVWHQGEECLYWLDIPNGRLYRFDPSTDENQLVYERTGGAIGGFTIQSDGALLLFMDRGTIGVWRGEGQELEILVEEIEPERESRFNDVIADPAGRVFCGTMSGPGGKGRLYRLDIDGSLTELLDEIGCSNGMGFTPTDERLYYIDSPTKLISRFDYDAATGDLSGREVFVDSTKDDGVPDGMTVDAEGCVWCARWDGSCLVRYDPKGREIQRVHFPTRKVSCASFGGPDLQDLYVTTAGGQDREANGPLAGSLFRLRPGVQGRAEFRSRIGVTGP